MKVNPKLAKLAIKATVGFVFSAMIGYTIKLEKKIEGNIDARYGEPKTETDQEN